MSGLRYSLLPTAWEERAELAREDLRESWAADDAERADRHADQTPPPPRGGVCRCGQRPPPRRAPLPGRDGGALVSTIPQSAALDLQLAACAGCEPSSSLLEVRHRAPGKRGMHQQFLSLADRGEPVGVIRQLAERDDVYLRGRATRPPGRRQRRDRPVLGAPHRLRHGGRARAAPRVHARAGARHPVR